VEVDGGLAERRARGCCRLADLLEELHCVAEEGHTFACVRELLSLVRE
jgi:hypothetical protein